MKRKVICLLILLMGAIFLTGCFGNSDDDNKEAALAFKNAYESMNGKLNKKEKEYRTVTISENNVFVEVTPEEIVKKIEDKGSFYVYFGSELCPWCRSVIEVADQISRDNDISKVYYVDIWDNEGNEILRDKYILNDNNELELSVKGTDTYKKLLEYFSDVLEDYNLTDSNGNSVPVGEKRIYAPNYFYIKDGKVERFITGLSDKQTASDSELTEEILEDERKAFQSFFANLCDEKC